MMRRERGFILATTLLVMTLLTVMLTAAFVMVSAEYGTTSSSYATSRSLKFAQAGLQSYFANPHTLTGTSDSTNYTFSGGYSRTVARRLRDSTGAERALWIVYSTGVDSTRSLAAQGSGTRVVAQLAYLDPGTLPARAAIVAANGINVLGPGTYPIDGRNLGNSTGNCSSSAGQNDTTALTSTGSVSAPPPANGAPEILGSANEVNDSTHIAWSRLLNGEFTPDVIVLSNGSGLPTVCSGTTYLTYYATGNLTIPTLCYNGGGRRGLLVVAGNLTMAHQSHWDGIIIAGGNVSGATNSSDYKIHGMIITGLNKSLGSLVAQNDLRRGHAQVQWDYCYGHAAGATQTYLVPIQSTFLDSWKTY